MLTDKNFNRRAMFFSERLIQCMNTAMQLPLTIIEAPMGYGKTTVVREYLKKSNSIVLWQTVYDNFSDNFWIDFCGLISEVSAAASQKLIKIGLPNDGLSIQEALRIIKTLPFSPNTFIILDDYHLASSKLIDTFISMLAKTSIQNLHVVITTRLAVFENIEELKLKNYVQHITKNDLEMTPADITSYCKLCGLTLSADESQKLYDYTEGWVSALYMIILTLAKNQSLKPQKIMWESLHMTDIYGLLENTVYNALPNELQQFLLTICLFDNVTESQAEFMWQKHNAGQLLAELVNRNAFITYTPKDKTYVIHNILTNYLKGLLAKQNDSHIKNSHTLAAQWFIQQKEYFHAMQHAYIAQEFTCLLEAVELDMGRTIGPDKMESVIEYFQNCPKYILAQHPLAVMIYAISLFGYDQMEHFADICAVFPGYIETNNNLDNMSKQRYMGEYETLIGLTQYNDIEMMFSHMQKAWDLLQQPVSFIDSEGGWWTFGSPSVLYMFYRESGHLSQDIENIHMALPLYNKLTSGHGSGGNYIMEGEWHFNLGQFENAQISAHAAFAVGTAASQPEIIICAMFLQMRIALQNGNYDQILSLLEQMRTEVRRRNTYFLLHTIDMIEGFIYAVLGQYDMIPQWVANGELKSSRIMFPAIGFGNIIYGRSMLLAGDYIKLIGISEQFMGIASVYPNLLAKIYTYVYVSAAYEKLFRSNDGLIALKQALDIALPDQLYMPFVENCDYIKPLLEKLMLEEAYSIFIQQIFKLFEKYKIAINIIIKNEFNTAKTNLTKREQEIAWLAAKGLSNIEIAEQLFVSSNTVKTQLKSVFVKLNISSRALLKQELQKLDQFNSNDK